MPMNSSQHLLTLIDSMIEGFVVHDSDGKVVYFNQSACNLLSMTPADLRLGTSTDSSWKIVREDSIDFSTVSNLAQLALLCREGQNDIILGIHSQGRLQRWVSATSKPVAVVGGQGFQILTTYHDVTELKKSRDDLRLLSEQSEKTRKFLKATLNSIPSLISYVDKNLIYRYVNASYEEWFRVPSGTLVGKSMEEVLGKEALAKLKPYVQSVLKGASQEFESEIPYQLAGKRHVQVTYIADTSASNEVEGFYVVVQDVTPQVRSKFLIQQKEEELARVINSLPALIGHWDSNFRNLHANSAYLEYFGWPPQNMKGVHIQEVLGSKLFEKNKPYLEAVLRGQPQTFERVIDLPNGESRHTLAQYLPDLIENEVQGFFTIVTDISPIKKLENERRHMEAKLVSSSKMSALGEMASGIAHEINNPLTIIQGKASLLRKAISDGQFNSEIMMDSIDKILLTVNRISKIINSLRSFAKDYADEPFACNLISSVLLETLEFCKERFKNHEIDLVVKIPDKPLKLECRSHQISQVFLNLLNNAHDAIIYQNSRWVQVEIMEVHEDIRITISDSGGPIPVGIRDKIFEPFFSTKEIGKGTGLGLSISKSIIEAHGGTLSLLPNSDNTQFEIRLPKIQPGKN